MGRNGSPKRSAPQALPSRIGEGESKRRARGSQLPTLGSNTILITRHCSRPLRARDRGDFGVILWRSRQPNGNPLDRATFNLTSYDCMPTPLSVQRLSL